jgi:hypothetical protein
MKEAVRRKVITTLEKKWYKIFSHNLLHQCSVKKQHFGD